MPGQRSFVELSPGLMITSRLRLVHPLGKGGMGEVWVAYHETLGCEVAIKLVDAAIARSNPATLGRFHREAGIAAKLNNPHVALTYDHGVLADGTPYIVMERLEGESLAQRIQRSGPLSLYETSLVVSQTAQALGKAHKLGIVHRDVKPGNLFCIDTDYELFIKLLDFGIAKHAGGLDKMELTNTRNMLGSPLYMSPEQFTSAKGVDWRGDLWSLAVVAYRCLTGAPPFIGEALGQVIMAVMHGQYKPVTNVRSDLPGALNDWFAKAFHKNINERFQSAKELGVSFAQITRNAASQGQPRPRLPSITEMSAGMFESVGHPAPLPAAPNQPIEVAPPSTSPPEKTADLPRAWRAASARPASVTAPLNRNAIAPHGAASKHEPAPMESAQAATFAPAATTIDERNDGKARLVMILAAVALLVCIGGYAAFSQTGTAALTGRETGAPAEALPAKGEASAETNKPAAQVSSAASARAGDPVGAPSSSSKPATFASASAESAMSAAATAATKAVPPSTWNEKPTFHQTLNPTQAPRKPPPIADNPGF